MRYFTAILPAVFLVVCTAPLHERSSSERDQIAAIPKAATDTMVADHLNEPVPSPVALPVAEWIGHRFFVLPKQELVQSAGYDLYSCKQGKGDSSKYAPEWELKNRRIRCENISGDTLEVKNVELDDKEWVVSFIHLRSGRIVYGRTRLQALQEIVLVDDLSNARHRWINKTVFSKRGSISTSGLSSRLSSLKVRITDSLIVDDIIWGMTPIPVMPLWLMVTVRSNGKKGFIPIRYSWTNTLSSMITDRLPWEDAIFEQDPRSLYNWDENIWELVENHRVIANMTKDQVRLSWGEPESIAPGNETWLYPSHECTFTGDTLVSIVERVHRY